jgi:hypothetical protein
MHLFATTTAEQVLQLGKMATVVEVQKATNDQIARVANLSAS